MMIDPLPASEKTDYQHPYLVASDTATPSCLELHLKAQILNLGSMCFDQWMELCLYHPTWGYYTNGAEKVGREGDFFTSVSVGKCFGMLLAHRIANYFQTRQLDKGLNLIELGANKGELARDILDTLRDTYPQIYTQVQYHICEPLAAMQPVQRSTLADHIEKLSHKDTLAHFQNPLKNAILLSNELIDAFPVKLLQKNQTQWHELHVTLDEEHFTWTPQPLSSASLRDFTKALPELPSSYTTEYRPGLHAFAQRCSQVIENGLIITIDYGHTRSSYYTPERHTGTLRTFRNHMAGENPLSSPGQCDITAHVDFTQLAQALRAAGFEPNFFDTQSRYLTQHAESWFHAIEQLEQPPSKLIRQFQTLTHPSMMGRQFYVLECETHLQPSSSTLDRLELDH